MLLISAIHPYKTAFHVASVLDSKDEIKQKPSVDKEINSWVCCILLQEVVQKYDTPSPLSHLLHLRWFMATGTFHSERLISYLWRLHLELWLTCRISPALCLIKVETVSARELFMGSSTSWNKCSVMSVHILGPAFHIHQDFQFWRTLHVHIQYIRFTLGMNKKLQVFKSTSLWSAGRPV